MVPHMVPRVTYRLQFHKGFRFADAAGLAPYLARLGISHVYASPYMKSRPGSTHGYDIVDHRALNPELGDQTDFDRMVAAFAENGLGPHPRLRPQPHRRRRSRQPPVARRARMGPGIPIRRLVRHRLEAGPSATCAPNCWFRFSASNTASSSRRETSLSNSTRERQILRYGRTSDHKLPICPLHYARILGDEHAELERMGDSFAGLPDWRPQIVRRAAELKAELGRLARDDAAVQQAIEAAVEPAERVTRLHARRPDPRPALARGAFPRRRGRHQLSPLLRHQRPCRVADGVARIVRARPLSGTAAC